MQSENMKENIKPLLNEKRRSIYIKFETYS